LIRSGSSCPCRRERRWSRDPTHLVFDPSAFLERLAAITPRPRINLILYYGVLAPRAAWRRDAVKDGRLTDATVNAADTTTMAPAAAAPARVSRNPRWAELMQRTFGFDVLACPSCGGRLRLVALIHDQRVIERILGHLGLPTQMPAARPARAPPLPAGDDPTGDITREGYRGHASDASC
jgi:hypothetical protein